MKVAPVGRERDIQIHVLKGFCDHDFVIQTSLATAEHYECKYCKESVYFLDEAYTNWSTNRNDAWELEKEFIEEDCEVHLWIEKLDVHNYRAFFNIRKAEIYPIHLIKSGLHTTPEEAIADCVSQAWITWKGEK